ncbi:hypothetical protein AB1K83_09455 [Sporosarcina sp. 179-K 3D1 HS]|uniref:hypothetical protein n=1 Tax=Sporosarcina sp. 179-K 3D1 HS TaxID=3232169 RepID=UPI0039A2252F
MFFDYRFWRYLVSPHELAAQLQTSTMHSYRKRVVAVFLLGVLLFATREIWGMNTEKLTALLSTMTIVDYTIARYVSLFGILLWAILYMAFHYWGVAYILHRITSIPFKQLLPLQLLATGLLLIEKLLVFLVFALQGETTSVSFLSFGPLANTFLDNWYIIYFLNQLTVTGAAIVGIQYRFIRSYPSENDWYRMLPVLIGLHVAMALITAAVGFIPVEEWFHSLVGRGVGE